MILIKISANYDLATFGFWYLANAEEKIGPDWYTKMDLDVFDNIERAEIHVFPHCPARTVHLDNMLYWVYGQCTDSNQNFIVWPDHTLHAKWIPKINLDARRTCCPPCAFSELSGRSSPTFHRSISAILHMISLKVRTLTILTPRFYTSYWGGYTDV